MESLRFKFSPPVSSVPRVFVELTEPSEGGAGANGAGLRIFLGAGYREEGGVEEGGFEAGGFELTGVVVGDEAFDWGGWRGRGGEGRRGGISGQRRKR